jgi:hypothetical protein
VISASASIATTRRIELLIRHLRHCHRNARARTEEA